MRVFKCEKLCNSASAKTGATVTGLPRSWNSRHQSYVRLVQEMVTCCV